MAVFQIFCAFEYNIFQHVNLSENNVSINEEGDIWTSFEVGFNSFKQKKRLKGYITLVNYRYQKLFFKNTKTRIMKKCVFCHLFLWIFCLTTLLWWIPLINFCLCNYKIHVIYNTKVIYKLKHIYLIDYSWTHVYTNSCTYNYIKLALSCLYTHALLNISIQNLMWP